MDLDLDIDVSRLGAETRDDPGRHEFLLALDDSDVNLTSWEAQFVESNYSNRTFSPAQRKVIDTLALKYPHVY